MQIIHKKQTYFEKKGGERIDKNGNKRFSGQAVGTSGMNAEFYKDMIDDYVYYWSLKKKLISDIKSKGLRYKTINGNGVVVEKTNDSVVNLQKTTATMLKILADLRLKDPVPEPEKATDGYL